MQVASCGLREMVRLQVAGRLGRVLQVVGFTVARARRGFREELLDAPCSRLSIVRFDIGPKRSMGHLLGAKKSNFLIRDIDDAAMAAAPVEICQSLPKRSHRGRSGSVLDVSNRLHRMRGRSHR